MACTGLLLVAAGALNTLAFAPFTLWWLPFFTLALLVMVISRVSHWRQALLAGFCYGLGWFGVGISWVHVSIDQFGGLPLIASLGLMALLVSYLALFPALAALLTYRFTGQHNCSRLAALIFAGVWVGVEWLRSFLLTGFPWLSLGYSQTSAGLADFAPLIGETGITFILAASAAALARLYQGGPVLQRVGPAVLAGVIVISAPLLQQLRGWDYQTNSANIVMVQGNIKQDLRWQPEQEWPTMLKYLDLTRPHFSNADIVIWPEAAIPQLEPMAEAFLDNLNKAAFYNDAALITGILDYNLATSQAWNNLIVLGKDSATATEGQYFYGHSNRFSKHHLLPIGEFVPFENWLRKLAPIFDLPMSSFTRGSYIQPNLRANDYQLLSAICFEIAFPRQIRANFTAATDFILTVSNDAWFGDSIGPHQHLQIAQMRAREFGRPVLRATNNGITASISPDGSIARQLPQFEEAILADTVVLSTGRTFYSIYGDWPLTFIVILLLIGALKKGRLH
ncbi:MULTISPECIES: apolipoprotein N-acyltransferase [unclassified Arsukibacterium]|uniref:apolipoprotein N-acyltransferase n=1 Tax=unclassified Arsukibacterium TaxID=2635278 RepID=UPI000C4EA92C|nr:MULTISPECIES: apolipoprotein N-acyltransferase [unclassified Arsukibacterium]MBM34540.1 apolipoprotein N-acyltransferase [Rheinheimera sp.]|tara:strand:+ start:22117 stop:23643 length:1527 start_codon:yes stop_codon:yes gene_type:complete